MSDTLDHDTRAIDQQPFYDLPDVAMKLGNCSRSTLYRLIEQGKLVRVRLGTKALITGKSLAGYVDELLAQ
jgi:excisionase family DNA binding protein